MAKRKRSEPTPKSSQSEFEKFKELARQLVNVKAEKGIPKNVLEPVKGSKAKRLKPPKT